MSDTEYTQFEELEKLSDTELEQLVIHGANLHIHTSRASAAKRILDNRRSKKQLETVQNVERITKQVESSNKELKTIVGGLSEIVKLLEYFKKKWLPNQSLWLRISVFIFSTVLIGIVLNLAADWIAKFIFKW